ncbi:hypothetical protein H0H87_012276 [Tephrocybe sp. NHM501043]|nr:hypothetical protein H0H87_012276 [Tephrocybe sp. NHM501043]
MSAFVHVFEATAHNVAKTGDFISAVQAPLDSDATNSWDKKVTELLQAIKKPKASIEAIPAVLDAIENAKGAGLDDRLLLLEDALVLMSRSTPGSEFSTKVQQYVVSLREFCIQWITPTDANLIVQQVYKDLPHPPRSYLAPFDASVSTVTTSPATRKGQPITYAFRSADGSNYNPLAPTLGKAGSPYARSVPPIHIVPKHSLPDPGLVFDQILRRKEFVPHPGGISSLFFAFADLVIHSIFDTDHHDPTKNKTSSYLDLSILYGNSESDVDQVRRKDGTGKLWDDVFSDARLLLMPPASCALLVLLNRNHNFIAEKLLDINENDTYVRSFKTDEERRIQDDEIFHRTRLINCGYFMNIILGDYVGAILGLVADGSAWRLDPLMDMRESDHTVSSRGEGNVVSVEFNLLYRWHATLSQQDASWTENKFKEFFPGKDLNKVTTQDFIETAHKILIPEPDVKKRTFGGLKRQGDGRFNDDDLARLIQDATEWRSAAYSSGCPEALRVIEILGIEQSRSWGTCSLNEFRKFLGLKPYNTFAEWNPDPRIHKAAETLYDNDINNLELHVGLQAEECKKPGPGAGLCPGYTISRAILSDAICLTRGDPYLTTEFNTKNCTQWGYDDCQYDKLDGSYGGLLTKLLFRTLPNNYPIRSVYAHFPFLVPGYLKELKLKENPGLIDEYTWERPPVASTPTVINTYTGAKQVLHDLSFISPFNSRLHSVVPAELGELSEDALSEGRTTVEKIICSIRPKKSTGSWAEYFQKEIKELIDDKSTKNYDGSMTVDIVRDVINQLPVHWISEEIFGLPLKTQSNQKGALFEEPTYQDFAALGRYAFSTVDPADDWHLRLDSKAAFSKLLTYVKGRFDRVNNPFSAAGFTQAAVDWSTVERTEHSVDFAVRVIDAFKETRPTNDELAAYSVAAIIPTAAHYSQAITHVVDFYLGDDKKEQRAEIVRLSASIGHNEQSTAKVMAYVREALRLNPPVSGVFRTAGANVPVTDFGTIECGKTVFVDLRNANLDRTAFKDPLAVDDGRSTQGLLWNEQGLLSPAFFEPTVPVIIGTLLGLRNIRRTVGNQGTLSKFTEQWHGIARQLYIGRKGKVTPFPPSLRVNFD